MRPHGKVDRFYPPSQNRGGEQSNFEYSRKELDAQQFFVDLCLLIFESRQPELSARGRVQGWHCPNSPGQLFNDHGQQESSTMADAKSNDRHICDESNEKCARAKQMENEVRQLWSRGIPACLTVAVLPDECSKQDNCVADAWILEKWTIQHTSKRTRDDKVLAGQFLSQAVRSHLHFSQLSAWLIASRGKSPKNLVYRVCMPGELETSVSATPSSSSISSGYGSLGSCSSSASSTVMEKHQFPLGSAGKNSSFNISVESLPRTEKMPNLNCYCCRPSTSGLALTAIEKKSDCTPTPPAQYLQRRSNTTSPKRVLEDSDDDQDIIEDPDSPESPLDTSRNTSYHSFCAEQRSSADDNAASSFGQAVAYVAVSLPPLVSSSTLQPSHGSKLTATNPLFDMASSTDFMASKFQLKTRVDALMNEANLLSAKLRTLQSTSSTSTATPGQPKAAKFTASTTSTFNYGSDECSCSKPRFFLADDEEEDEDCDYSDQKSDQVSKSPESGQLRKRSPISKDEDERNILTDVDGTLSEWIHQTVDTNGSTLDISETGTVVSGEDIGHFEEKREAYFKGRHIREKMEFASLSLSRASASVQHGRKTKRLPPTSAVHFHPKTGLPLSSSPAPLKRNHSSFNYDPCISSVSTLKSALYYYDHESGGSSDSDSGWPLCKSAPASTNLLGSFEESALNGRIKPFGSIDGFTLELGASGAFCPSHVTLPATTLFFNISEDNAPSPYFGLCSLESIGRRGYHVPKKGSVQATLFNPQGTVVKMFVVRYDLGDMPSSCQTFVRQRTFFMPSSAGLRDAMANRSWLRYLIHLRFASSSSGKLFLHTDIRMLFSRKSELEAYNFNCVDGAGNGPEKKMDTFELRSFTEMPKDPKFSPRKFSRSEKDRKL